LRKATELGAALGGQRDATSLEPFQEHERDAFNGLCPVILRSTGQAETMVLNASSPGLAPAEVKVKAEAAR